MNGRSGRKVDERCGSIWPHFKCSKTKIDFAILVSQLLVFQLDLQLEIISELLAFHKSQFPSCFHHFFSVPRYAHAANWNTLMALFIDIVTVILGDDERSKLTSAKKVIQSYN